MRLGIDLGTTRTVVAAVDRGNYPLLEFETAEGDLRGHVPSVVAEVEGRLIYGEEAERQARRGAPHLRSFKRLLGRHGPQHRVTLGAVEASLLELLTGFVAHVVEQLRTASTLSGPIDEVVIAVPANAHSSQRFATLEACRAAGLEVLAMLNEPSAAGIEYAHRHRKTLNSRRDHVAIYDLGGGTFDAALVMVADDHHEVIDTSGIQELGGDDFDALLLSLALAGAGIGHAGDALPLLLEECRDAKEAIQPQTRRVVLHLDALGERRPAEPVVIPIEDFYEQLRPLVDLTVESLVDAVTQGEGGGLEALDAHAAEAGVAGIYVVGGASALPAVARQLRERLGRRVFRSPHPGGAVAMGLAIHADEAQASAVDERFTRHLGVFREAEAGGRVTFDPIFARGTPMPKAEPLVVTRRYRAAHNLGHYRFVECSRIDRGGEPSGDITPHGEIRFAFSETLRGAPLVEAEVTRLDAGPLVEERYELDPAGVVAVTLADLDSGFSQRFVL
ncbi:MAG: Hsp70 family protein [Myxococcales bacterium]|nr:Hsp70 family protein [Myxococcales bacterium]